MSMSRYLDLFLSESREHLAAIERDIAILDRSPDDAPALQELFRHAHSIKGMAASMGYPKVADLAHAVEEALDGVKRGAGPFDETMKTAVLLAFDGIDRMIAEIEAHGEPAVDTGPMYAALGRLGRRAGPAPLRAERERHGSVGTRVPQPGAPSRGGAPLSPTDAVDLDEKGLLDGEGSASASVDGGRLISISVRFEPDSTLPSARAAVALKRLEAHGLLVRCVPSVERLAKREFDGLLEVLLRTEASPERLAEELRRLTDVRSVEMTPVEDTEPARRTGGETLREAPSPEGAAPPRSEMEPGAIGMADSPDSLRSPGLASDRTEKSAAPRPMPHAASSAIPPAGAEPSRPERGLPSADPASTSTVRVPARSLDTFLDAIGELIVQRGRLDALLEPGRERAVRVALDRLKGLTDRLFGDVMALRMLPFDSIAHRFSRSVRELAEKQHKKVSLRVSGGETLLDRSVLDELTDPINHILRNAVDHGIEPPEARRLAGKPETGSIAISLERAGDAVTLRIEDDGRGMDPGRIGEAAIRKGFVTRGRLKTMGDQEVLMLTTIPGFSTADRVTNVSGRGVGMDVVRTRVETLGGRLRLHSRPGLGLTVAMRLPLTIVVVKAFLVEAGRRRWAVPLSAIRRTVALGEGRVVTRGGRDYLMIEGEETAVPLLDLAATLGLPSGIGRSFGSEALIAADREPPVAFAVDGIVGRREIVVKPLRRPLEELRGFSGATILEDGSIALILDLASLAQL